MNVEISSTTDSKEAVIAAMGGLAQKETVVEKQSAPAQATEQGETAEESETSEEQQTQSESENDLEQEQSDEEAEGQEEEQKTSKKKNGFKKKIHKLSSELSSARQEAEHWKQQALNKQQNPSGQKDQVAEENVSKQEATGRPKADDFETHEEYLEAVAEWKFEQREAQKAQKAKEAELKAEFQKIEESHNKRLAEFRKTQADFDEVVSEFIEEHGDVQFSPALNEFIKTSENGPAVLYDLLKNPSEFERLNSLSYGAANREIGKLEAKFIKASESEVEPKTVKTTKAPAPINPVGSKASAVAKSLDEMDYEEYRKVRAEQSKKNRR